MVYCGKPSRGCQMCRTRRIKCDESKPTCLQCRKSRRQCPGYKSDFDVVFRNETRATERRARRPAAKSSTKPRPDGSPAAGADQVLILAASPTASSTTPASTVPAACNLPTGEQARCYFLANFVLNTRGKHTNGYMTHLLPLLRANEQDAVLSNAFSAVALASFGNRLNSKRILYQARIVYGKALQGLNEALRHPTAHLKDTTLASVLLLGLFEQVLSMKTTITAWESHTQGAAQLIRLRGKRQFESDIGRAMFQTVRSQYVVYCYCSSTSPLHGVDWWIPTGGENDHNIYHHVERINLAVAALRYQLNQQLENSRSTDNTQKVQEIMRQCGVLEKKAREWMDSAPPEWQFKRAAWVESFRGQPEESPVCPGRLDVYPDVWSCSVWNYLRVSRLFLIGMMMRCTAWLCAPMDYRTTPEYAVACRVGSEIVTDIIASLPYCLGAPGVPTLSAESGSAFACGVDEPGAPKALGGYYSVWPTFSVLNSDFTTDIQRKYAHGRLHFISNEMGVNQAKVLSHLKLRLPSMTIRRDAMALTPPAPGPQEADSSAGSPTSSVFSRGDSPSESISSIGSGAASVGMAETPEARELLRAKVARSREEVLQKAAHNGGASSVDSIKAFWNIK